VKRCLRVFTVIADMVQMGAAGDADDRPIVPAYVKSRALAKAMPAMGNIVPLVPPGRHPARGTHREVRDKP
jgi:hypothetical protein